MIGQTYKGRMCGSFGTISTMSFYPNKHVTTGEGGMVLTDDENLHAKIAARRNLCFTPARRFVQCVIHRYANDTAARSLHTALTAPMPFAARSWAGITA